MSKPTEHGNNIAEQIQEEDVYGCRAIKMTLADVWIILDNLHSHFLSSGQDTSLFEKWMRELEGIDKDLPCI